MDGKSVKPARTSRASRKSKPSVAPNGVVMDCLKCGKPMHFEASTRHLVGKQFGAEAESHLVGRVMICESCEQPYIYLKVKDELVCVVLTEARLGKFDKQERAEVDGAIRGVVGDVRMMNLIMKWVERLTV